MHGIVFVEGVGSSQEAWICWWFPAICFPQVPTALAELRLGEHRMYFWKASVAPSCALLGLGLARLQEGQRGEGQKMKGSLKPFAEMQGRMTLSLNYSGFSKHRMKCWMWQCSPCQHSVWEAARQREVKRVCSAAGTAAGPCQLTSDLLRAYQ